jgi:hypothetical protein
MQLAVNVLHLTSNGIQHCQSAFSLRFFTLHVSASLNKECITLKQQLKFITYLNAAASIATQEALFSVYKRSAVLP